MTAPERDRATRTRTVTVAATATSPRRAAKAAVSTPSTVHDASSDTRKRAEAGQNVTSELLEGSRLLQALAPIATDGAGPTLLEAAETVGKVDAAADALQLALDPVLIDLAASCVDPAVVTRYDRE